MAKVKTEAQIGMEDQFIEDAELENLLEERDELNDERLDVAGRFREKDAAAKERVGVYDIPMGEYRRVGRFIVQRKMTESAEVSFSRGGGERIQIRKVEADGEAPGETDAD